MSNNNLAVKEEKSLVKDMANKYGVDAAKLFTTLKLTAFRQQRGEPTNEQMMALLIVADQYNLNPFTREIFAFPGKNGEITPVVSVDGWSRIINEQPAFDGIEFNYSDSVIEIPGAKPCPEWVETVIYRKDRERPTKIREWLDETYQHARKFPGPWQTHTKRFLRHKSFIQCARIAFGFGGIYDADEAQRIRESEKDMGSVSVVSNSNAPDAPSAPALHSVEHEEAEYIEVVYDEISEDQKKAMHSHLVRVVEHAAKIGAWEAGREHLVNRFKEGEQQYATQVLSDAEASFEANAFAEFMESFDPKTKPENEQNLQGDEQLSSAS